MSLIMKEQIFEHRKKCRKNLKHIISLSFFLTSIFLLCLLLKQFLKYFTVFQRGSYNLHHANCPSCHLKATLFVLVRLKGRENEQFSHPMGDIERGGEFTRLLKS